MNALRIAFLSLSILASCGALGAVSDATARLDSYTLSPYQKAGPRLRVAVT